uniref:Uncharacterized protein n=1 Tax=Oryza meridionalis TaxID=40149 RepID=A0A0E0EPI4_9ORYZ
MKRSLQKYGIHLDGSQPLPTINRMKKCAWCSLRDSQTICNTNFRSCGAPGRDRSGSEHME